MEFAILLRLVGVMKLIVVLSRPFTIQGRESYVISFKTTTTKQMLVIADYIRRITVKSCAYGEYGSFEHLLFLFVLFLFLFLIHNYHLLKYL